MRRFTPYTWFKQRWTLYAFKEECRRYQAVFALEGSISHIPDA